MLAAVISLSSVIGCVLSCQFYNKIELNFMICANICIAEFVLQCVWLRSFKESVSSRCVAADSVIVNWFTRYVELLLNLCAANHVICQPSVDSLRSCHATSLLFFVRITCWNECSSPEHGWIQWSWAVTVIEPLKPTVAIWDGYRYIKHPVPDRVKPSFVIFDIQALWRSALSVRVPGCQKLQMTA